ncbi:MAG: penicillin-binding protein 2 [Prevotellaceae bacterium]|nr:penicillin-binding protein 2 [Prevotellaceae bacterium]
MNEFANRKIYITGFFVLVFAIIVGRLFYIQIVDSYYKRTADQNAMRYEYQYPARGLIFDRNGTLLVGNQTVYDIVVIPREVAAFDTTALARVLGMTEAQVHSTLNAIKAAAKKNAAYQPALFCRQVSTEAFALLQEKWFKFPGFYAQARSIRAYPRRLAGNLIGYIGEADTASITADPFYIQGSFMGKIGIERSYENALRGKRGLTIYMRDKLNRVRDRYAGGAYDTVAIPGANIVCTIDADLQEYGEQLMQNKVGSIVAVEPATGEILTLVSTPNFDPELFIDVHRAGERNALALDPLKPLFNRAVMAQYPPGSIFKCVNALVGLQEGTVSVNTTHACDGGYYFGNRRVGCHRHASPLNLIQSLQMSCNAYYCHEFRGIIDKPEFGSPQAGFAAWRRHVESFGIGQRLESDIPNELRGLLPTAASYDKMHGANRWKSATILSLAIGQGELGVTPLHMANLAATIANRGYYYTPHVAKSIQGGKIDRRFLTPHTTTISREHFAPVVEGMYLAVNGDVGSTARWTKMPDVPICGKTGTAQNPHGEDHSVFICFAPKDNPKIALAVYVENSGAGASWAAPTASLMVEKYLKKAVTRKWLEGYVMNANLLPQNTQNGAAKKQ